MYSTLIAAVCVAALISSYLWHANRAITTIPPEALKLVQKPWTDTDIKSAYSKVQSAPTDVRPFLYGKHGRRYVVCGGSGLVGGWIVRHLIMRGEDPAAIRILDLSAPTRQDASDVAYIKVDVTDSASVAKGFQTPWPESVASLPLTVFHTVAYINAADRKAVFLTPYRKVNIEGTRNMIKASKEAGASCFVATSSASVGLRPVGYWPLPWQRWPTDNFQFLPNADPKSLDAPLESFGSCYAWSKAQAEKLVRGANSSDFPTGAIRPGHAIYGHGVEQISSLTWQYLGKGGAPTWLSGCVAQFVNAQNVSIAHLAFENALLKPGNTVGGNAYCVSDPGPPIRYGELYKTLSALAHPSTPVSFPVVPSALMLLIAYLLEAYELARLRFLPALPRITGELAMLKPATFNMCTLHLVYTDERARDEIGYRSPITTQEGFALAMKNWNDKAEAKVAKGKQASAEMQNDSIVPQAPMGY